MDNGIQNMMLANEVAVQVQKETMNLNTAVMRLIEDLPRMTPSANPNVGQNVDVAA